MLEKNKTVQLDDEEVKQVSGGGDYCFDEVTQLLKDAGDRAWAALGYRNELWKTINKAQFSSKVLTRMIAIDEAIDELEGSWKDSFSSEDYDYIYQKLIKSQQITKQCL
ncbi:MAG: hypothetical protein KBT35_08410 [Firmicutes bacterium]|nr:hypothetical protein [Candidatus Colivicinus equi]